MPIEPGNTLTLKFADQSHKESLLTLICEAEGLTGPEVTDEAARVITGGLMRGFARAEQARKAAANAARSEPLQPPS